MKITLRNGFHSTSVTIRLTPEQERELRSYDYDGISDWWSMICYAAMARKITETRDWRRLESHIRRTLCCTDCMCGVVR